MLIQLQYYNSHPHFFALWWFLSYFLMTLLGMCGKRQDAGAFIAVLYMADYIPRHLFIRG